MSSSNQETTYTLAITRVSPRDDRKTPSDIVHRFIRPLFLAADALEHTLRVVAPTNETSATPITSYDDFPQSAHEYLTDIREHIPGTLRITIRIVSSMQPSKLRGLCCHKSSDHDMKKFMSAMDYLIRMEILDTVTTNHSPGMIIVNSNEWDDCELACSEIVQRAITQTSAATSKELFSITWRKIASPREGSSLYTYALVIDVDDLLRQDLVDMLGTVGPDTSSRHGSPLTWNWRLYRAQLSNDCTLEELEATIKLQNEHPTSRYLCTINNVPNGVDMFSTPLNKRVVEPGYVPASIIMFDKAWYKELGMNYNSLITKLGKMKNGTYYVQGSKETHIELLSFLHNDLRKMLGNLFGDSYDFTEVVIVGRKATSEKPEKATTILARAHLSTTCDQPPNFLAPTIRNWSESEDTAVEKLGMGLFGALPPSVTGLKLPDLVAVSTISATTPSTALTTSIGGTLTSAAFELSMTQHKDMVQRTVRADLQVFGKALVEIFRPQATFDPFNQDNCDGNETTKEDTTSNDVTLPKVVEAGAANHGSMESAEEDAEAQSDDDDDEFRANIRAAAALYETNLFASKQSFDNLCDKGLSEFEDSCMTEDDRGKSMLADLDNHHDTSWDCSLSFKTAKQSSADEKRQSITKEDSERSAEKTAPPARQSTPAGLTHAEVENAVLIPIGEPAQKEAAVQVKQLDCGMATDVGKASGSTPQASNVGRTSGSPQTPLSTPISSTPEYVQTMRTTEYNLKLRVQSTVIGGISQNSHETLLKIVEAAITLLRTRDHTIGIMHPWTDGYASFDPEQVPPLQNCVSGSSLKAL